MSEERIYYAEVTVSASARVYVTAKDKKSAIEAIEEGNFDTEHTEWDSYELDRNTVEEQ